MANTEALPRGAYRSRNAPRSRSQRHGYSGADNHTHRPDITVLVFMLPSRTPRQGLSKTQRVVSAWRPVLPVSPVEGLAELAPPIHPCCIAPWQRLCTHTCIQPEQPGCRPRSHNTRHSSKKTAVWPRSGVIISICSSLSFEIVETD